MENFMQIFEHTLKKLGSEIKKQIKYMSFECPDEFGIYKEGIAHYLTL